MVQFIELVLDFFRFFATLYIYSYTCWGQGDQVGLNLSAVL